MHCAFGSRIRATDFYPTAVRGSNLQQSHSRRLFQLAPPVIGTGRGLQCTTHYGSVWGQHVHVGECHCICCGQSMAIFAGVEHRIRAHMHRSQDMHPRTPARIPTWLHCRRSAHDTTTDRRRQMGLVRCGPSSCDVIPVMPATYLGDQRCHDASF